MKQISPIITKAIGRSVEDPMQGRFYLLGQPCVSISVNQEPGTETNIYTFLYYLTQGNETAGKKIFRSGPEIATGALGMGEVTQGEEPEKGEKGI